MRQVTAVTRPRQPEGCGRSVGARDAASLLDTHVVKTSHK